MSTVAPYSAPMEDESSEIPARSPAPVLSIVAIVLSVGALLVSVFEVSAICDEQRTQVWPCMSAATQYSSEGFRLALLARASDRHESETRC